MLVLRYRLAIAAVITATAIAVPAAALASGYGSPSAKPVPPQAPAASGGKSAVQSQLPALAAAARISADRLQAGLAAAKRAGGNTAAGIAAFAASAGVSQATAQRVVDAVFGTRADSGSLSGKPAPGPAASAGKSAAGRSQPSVTAPAAEVDALATRLGVSHSAVQRALNRLAALSGEGGVDPTSPAFAMIAHDLGVSPARLAAALDAVKQSLAGQ
jgi:hypothetical protein